MVATAVVSYSTHLRRTSVTRFKTEPIKRSTRVKKQNGKHISSFWCGRKLSSWGGGGRAAYMLSVWIIPFFPSASARWSYLSKDDNSGDRSTNSENNSHNDKEAGTQGLRTWPVAGAERHHSKGGRGAEYTNLRSRRTPEDNQRGSRRNKGRLAILLGTTCEFGPNKLT